MSVLSAGVIPVRGDRVLILRVYRYWDFPKGLVEKGEDPIATARRELNEEAGIAEVDLTGEYRETPPYGREKKIARYYLGLVETEAVTLSREHHGFKWATFAEARELLGPRLRPILRWASEQIAALE